MEQSTVREAVGVFDNIADLSAAVAELEATAFPRQDISVLGGEKDMQKRFGADDIKVAALEDNPHTPRTVLVRPEEKVIGAGFMVFGGFYAGAVTAVLAFGPAPLLTTLLLVAIGGSIGAMCGATIAWALYNRYQGMLRRQVSNGGVPLWVRTPGSRQQDLARKIMRKHGGKDVHTHNIE